MIRRTQKTRHVENDLLQKEVSFRLLIQFLTPQQLTHAGRDKTKKSSKGTGNTAVIHPSISGFDPVSAGNLKTSGPSNIHPIVLFKYSKFIFK